VALTVSKFEVTPLTKESYIDTTDLVEAPNDGRIETALKDPKCCYGFISPSLKKRVMEAIETHDTLTREQERAVLVDGE
jgi:hypothetical protein